jgi:hypothetical protein
LDGEEPLTLEVVRADPVWAQVTESVEKPLRDELATVTADRDRLVQENDLRSRDAAIAEYASKTANPEVFTTEFKALCDEKGVKTPDGVHSLAAPLLMQELDRQRTVQATTPAKSRSETLAELFKVGGAGSTEAGTTDDGDKKPPITQEERAIRGTSDGGLVPEDD